MVKTPGKSKKVYTTGVTEVDKAAQEGKTRSGEDTRPMAKAGQLVSVARMTPSQGYAYQRAMAHAALALDVPEGERLMVLGEVLASLGLGKRLMPRIKE